MYGNTAPVVALALPLEEELDHFFSENNLPVTILYEKNSTLRPVPSVTLTGIFIRYFYYLVQNSTYEKMGIFIQEPVT